MKKKVSIVELVLRVGIAGTFIGHGCYALKANPAWIPLITIFGISSENACRLLPLIGTLDIIIAVLVLLKPYKMVLYWAIFWTFITALSRVIAGYGILEFVERFSNMACPATLLIYVYLKDKNGSNKP